ncbi:hypothetical protein AFCA_003271 [Aspergillus flavus]|uniref:Unnamed protein product n=2 Tax=Aspergillus oryzae TaxID=5062 RepID=A0AAN4YR29_ASPOZ|nr:hypothetical protein AFCA_003271 [Aspergillus flavus]GMF73340.1 unnamed protein product [Aspergillus oryzae]GMG44741.1 unnamed protein product [Aspergillus oryzae var. brunneus]GMF92302.1 unnamed protein product [Aspergillus oryzae]GMG01016.1 unnamed protein product [Aspergillus oryzae]
MDLFSLTDRTALVTGGTRGIGQQMAIAMAEAGADIILVQVLQVNLSTIFTLCRDIGAYMLTRTPDSSGHRGNIINIASLVSFQGGLTVPAYAAAKGGVAQLTKALSNEWAAKGINVNAIAPGYVATDMNTALLQDPERSASILARIPAGRWATPEDFKGVTIFLASRASGYVSGEILTVDGGWMGR